MSFASVSDIYTRQVLSAIRVTPRDRHLDMGVCHLTTSTVSDTFRHCNCCHLTAEAYAEDECWWCRDDRMTQGTYGRVEMWE